MVYHQPCRSMRMPFVNPFRDRTTFFMLGPHPFFSAGFIVAPGLAPAPASTTCFAAIACSLSAIFIALFSCLFCCFSLSCLFLISRSFMLRMVASMAPSEGWQLPTPESHPRLVKNAFARLAMRSARCARMRSAFRSLCRCLRSASDESVDAFSEVNSESENPLLLEPPVSSSSSPPGVLFDEDRRLCFDDCERPDSDFSSASLASISTSFSPTPPPRLLVIESRVADRDITFFAWSRASSPSFDPCFEPVSSC
mmetsp:Transcript_7241/g.17555  ORF Transcript_7241/g.17555 Transcript_7241/m.17555 type:complete len:254 (-) Transcript_7241:2313-3074(-)